jgi:hypothetical protein
MKYCLSIIIIGLLLCSIGFNFILYDKYEKLLYKVNKLETGPAKGLFLKPHEESSQQLNEEEINNLIREMSEEMLRYKII